jgi:hypothetical protein
MMKSARIAVAATLLLGGTSLATAQNSQPTDGFRGVTGGADGNHFRPGKRPTAANQYYSLFDYYAVPHYNSGYAYSHVPAMSRGPINQRH